jgi:hypothetical protein
MIELLMKNSKEAYLIYKEGEDTPIGEYREKPGPQEQIYFTPFEEVLFYGANVFSIDTENKRVIVHPKIFLAQEINPNK